VADRILSSGSDLNALAGLQTQLPFSVGSSCDNEHEAALMYLAVGILQEIAAFLRAAETDRVGPSDRVGRAEYAIYDACLYAVLKILEQPGVERVTNEELHALLSVAFDYVTTPDSIRKRRRDLVAQEARFALRSNRSASPTLDFTVPDTRPCREATTLARSVASRRW
jgi:hypothetical protein